MRQLDRYTKKRYTRIARIRTLSMKTLLRASRGSARDRDLKRNVPAY